MNKRAGGIVVWNTKPLKIALAKQYHKGWSFPKGHIDEGEKDEEAASRECCEETGLKNLKLVKKLGSLKRHTIHADHEVEIEFFLFKATNPDELVDNPESEVLEAKWFTLKEAMLVLHHEKEKEFLKEKEKEILKLT